MQQANDEIGFDGRNLANAAKLRVFDFGGDDRAIRAGQANTASARLSDGATMRVLTKPQRTAVTTSNASSLVTRRPRTKVDSTPAWSSH